MSEQLDWEVYRYVLDDPTLDRTAFEACMLDDVDMALAVAEAMSHVDSIRAASFIAVPKRHAVSNGLPANGLPANGLPASGAGITGWRLSSLAALAAGALLAIGVMNYQVFNSFSPVTAQPSVVKQSLAESWLAIRQTELVDVSSNMVDASSSLVDASTSWEPTRLDENLPDAMDSVDEDWLMDAAREFYAQGEAG